ncbi:hypothetical protein [Massilia glaciei]|uniref:Uncharacterized protein n=1 Tax=Massilia glaciei TaxID=1524097 RepID=A0A2U2HEZ9_9BURK|nr:hypothetical protein [Massilia glaciei]PWF42471.1 hypothetical protein C7C56_022880 [Massilia glaciei]
MGKQKINEETAQLDKANRRRESKAGQGGKQGGAGAASAQNPNPQLHESNGLAGGLPRSPAAPHLSADAPMDDDTGLSNTANRQSVDTDQGGRQVRQSNVGRRDDGTPD